MILPEYLDFNQFSAKELVQIKEEISNNNVFDSGTFQAYMVLIENALILKEE